jgi:photosystem I P700 chlorophyll a apoprotein A2
VTGRGGTCDISAWDAFYLSMFWMLNTIGWTTFYWHWKHITLWLGNPGQFDESSNYIGMAKRLSMVKFISIN